MEEELEQCEECKNDYPADCLVVCGVHNKSVVFQPSPQGYRQIKKKGLVCSNCFNMHHTNCR